MKFQNAFVRFIYLKLISDRTKKNKFQFTGSNYFIVVIDRSHLRIVRGPMQFYYKSIFHAVINRYPFFL